MSLTQPPELSARLADQIDRHDLEWDLARYADIFSGVQTEDSKINTLTPDSREKLAAEAVAFFNRHEEAVLEVLKNADSGGSDPYSQKDLASSFVQARLTGQTQFDYNGGSAGSELTQGALEMTRLKVQPVKSAGRCGTRGVRYLEIKRDPHP